MTHENGSTSIKHTNMHTVELMNLIMLSTIVCKTTYICKDIFEFQLETLHKDIL